MLPVNIEKFDGGCNYSDDLTSLASNESPNAMNVVFEKEVIYKRFGFSVLTPTASGSGDTVHSLADLGVASSGRKLISHQGSKVYKQDNLDGVLDVILNTAPDSRSYNTEVNQYLIQTYDNGSAEYYWDGVAASMAVLSASAPGFKHVTETTGYLLGGSIASAKLRVYYENINTMIDGTYADYFTIRGQKDDEITGWLDINGRTYATTKTGIYRISFVGGITVFEDRQVVSSTGMVPGTGQTVITDEFGEVAIFMGYDMNLYLFDGAFVRVLSKKFRFSNNDTEIAMDRIEKNYLVNATSVFDTLSGVYRLMITKKGRDENRYCMNIDTSNFAYYPFDNMAFHSVTVAQDRIGRRYLVAGGYDGKIYKLFSNTNLDADTAVVDLYESPPVTQSAPLIHKAQNIGLLFEPVANYKLPYSDRTDFDKTWKARVSLPMYYSRDRFLGVNIVLGKTANLGSDVETLSHQLNLPIQSNFYRFRLQSGATAGQICQYTTGTVSGTGGGTSITGVGTAWTSGMIPANGWKINITSGNHSNEVYDFTYVSGTSATVGTMAAGNFAGASYELYRTDFAGCGYPWKLKQIDYNAKAISVGKAEPVR